MKYKIFIINLDRSTERYQHVLSQLSAWPDLPVERVSAADGRQMTEQQLSRYYSADLNRHIYYKMLKNAEKGCFISHIRCWQQIIEQQLDFAIILEDDFILDGDISSLLDAVAALNPPWYYLKLAAPYKKQPVLQRVPLQAFELVTYTKNPIATLAQAVSQAGARLLLQQLVPFGKPVDVMLQHTWQLGIEAKGIEPFLFRAEFSFASEIAGKRNEQLNRILFYKNRIGFLWHNLRHNVRHYGWRKTLRAKR
ncbi:glycosyltransferase family 25 protein [Chromatiaceae bacterium AAb-1]|nr:glycosyltransferase family 25 protein [Chromatiaceae bacterium AAb-1]